MFRIKMTPNERRLQMAIPKPLKRSVSEHLTHYCDRKFPLHLRDKVWATHHWRGDTVTLSEWRPRFNDPTQFVDIKIAQMRLDTATGLWSLFCADRNGKWHRYYETDSTPDFAALLQEVDEDPTGVFWG